MTRKDLLRMACLVACAMSSGHALADLPLAIEGLMVDKGKIRLDLSMIYHNTQGKSLQTGDAAPSTATPATADATPMSCQCAIGERLDHHDSLTLIAGLRYGLTTKAELYGRANASISQQRIAAAHQSASDTRHQLNDLWAGFSYQLKRNDDTPALLAFAEVALMERRPSTTSHFSSALLGATALASIDPVVLSMTAMYQIRRPYRTDGFDYRPGNLLFLTPSVLFAANDRVTLSTGVHWSNEERSGINGNLHGIRQTSTALQFGISYAVSKETSLHLNVKTSASGREGAETRLNWIHTI